MCDAWAPETFGIIVTSDSISRFIPTFIPTVFVLVAVVLDPALAQGQTAADLFNPDVVQEIKHQQCVRRPLFDR
jgi:hypothetical protein